MRQTQGEAFPDRVTIRRVQRVSDGFGGFKGEGEPVIVAEGVPARIAESQLQVMPGQAARDVAIEKWSVRVPVGTDIRDDDLVDWFTLSGGAYVDTGFTFKVENLKSRSWQTAISATAERIR